MNTDADFHKNKRTDKTYISPAIKTEDGNLRMASKVIDSEGLFYAREKTNVVLRRTEKARTEIIAKFLEDDRQLQVVTLQAFNGNSGLPQRTHFSFVGSEIPRLLAFFQNIAELEFQDSGKVNITDNELRKLILSKQQASSLVHENPELFTEILRAELTKEDIVSLGYRKSQLVIFYKYLNDPEYFQNEKVSAGITSDEALWQLFFEKNQWIFGYGLSYFFVTGFDDRKLEQFVRGSNLLQSGKQADAMLKTRGFVNSLCFAEIKRHDTELLENRPYRTGAWAPSRELAGAVAQVQAVVAASMEKMYGLLRPKDKEGNPTGEEVFNYKPKAFIVIGNLNEFSGDTGVNTDKLRSFELYRNSITGIDILTFDELYERSKFIVDSADISDTQTP